MHATLIAKIRETLATVPEIKLVFSNPKTKLAKFPCVFVKPLGYQGSWETNREDAQTYSYGLDVIVGTSGTTVEAAFGTVLPKAVDAVTAAFVSAWDGGVIEGHRVRCRMAAGGEWQVSEAQDGLVCWAPLTLEFRLLTDV